MPFVPHPSSLFAAGCEVRAARHFALGCGRSMTGRRRAKSKRSSPGARQGVHPQERSSASDWPHPAIVAIVLVGFALVFAALGIGSYSRTSATWDEPGHLAAGYAALVKQDYRLDIEHTPLVRMWFALPLAAMGDIAFNVGPLDTAKPEAVAFGGPFELGHRFLYKDNDADRLLYRARFMVVLLGIVLGILIFSWVGEWLGFRAAAIALLLYTAEPNLNAHASLATTDLGVTCFMCGAIYFLWRITRQFSWWNVAGLVGCFVLAVLSKFSAIILAPVVVVLMALAVLRGASLTVRTALAIAALLLAATWVCVWAAYGFRYEPSSTAGWVFSLHNHPAARQAVPTWAAIVSWIDAYHLLPNAFTQGFLHGQGLVQGRPAFLAGSYSNFGWWYYFPAAFLFKTPLAILILFLGGLVLCVRRRRLLAIDGEAFVLVPLSAILAVAMTSTLNIGLRHVLPMYPFVIVLAAVTAHTFITSRSSRAPRFLIALLIAGVLEFALVYPNTLAFFNLAVGGPHNGFRYLADSNVDWGQDLKPLKKWMDRNRVPHINLAYFGVADPAYYQINCTHIWGTTIPGLAQSQIGPPKLPGYVAVSVTLLDGVPFGDRDRDFYKVLRDREPAADIGGSIRVYWVEREWWR
jgi:hypothetical protein